MVDSMRADAVYQWGYAAAVQWVKDGRIGPRPIAKGALTAAEQKHFDHGFEDGLKKTVRASPS